MNCGCEHGMKCTKVSACGVDDMINEAVYQAESKWEDKHLAFVAQVREAVTRLHAEWCAGKGDSLETVMAVSAGFDRLLVICEVK